MIKKIVIEKLYLLLSIFTFGGYTVMSMLTIEKDSIYAAEDPILLKLFLGLLVLLTSGYIFTNINLINGNNKIKRLLLIITIYLAISKLMVVPITASVLAYIYQPLQIFIFVILFLWGQVIASKPKVIFEFFTTGMIIAMLITAFYYYKNWEFANEVDEAHLGTSYYGIFILLPILF